MSGNKFTVEERIQAARICGEGKMSASKMSKKLGVRKSLVIEWIYRYWEHRFNHMVKRYKTNRKFYTFCINTPSPP